MPDSSKKNAPQGPDPERDPRHGEFEKQLEQLAALPDPIPLTRAILDPQNRERLAAMLPQLETKGDECAAAGQWADAVISYRVASNAMLLFDYYERRVQKKLDRAEMSLLDQRCAGPVPPVPRPFRWRKALDRVEWLAMNGRFDQASRLLDRVSNAPAEHGDQAIETSGRFELIGDHTARTKPESARWFYRKASEWFRGWVASSSSGAEGCARSQERDRAAAKLAKLEKRGR